jgi:hypothetical protein
MNLADWEMYRSRPQEELDAAVKHLNRRLFQLVTTHSGWKNVRDEMYKVMDKYIELGARDTEPETALCDALEIHYPDAKDEISRW